jgi:hypothetical protein
MTPSEIRNEIVDRFGCLVRCGDLSVEANDILGILTLKGKILAVESMHEHVMQKYVPNDCRQIMEYQQLKTRKAHYTYKFS